MENLKVIPFLRKEDVLLKDFVVEIYNRNQNLSFHSYVDFVSFDLDLLINYKGFSVCAVMYARNTFNLNYEKSRMPLILKSTMIPIGVIIDDNRNCYIFSCRDKIECQSIEYLSRLINETISSIPMQLDTNKIKLDLLRIYNNSNFKNKNECQKIFENACNNLIVEKGIVRMPEDIEDDFFFTMLGKITSTHICRYISLDSLFTMLNKREVTMCTPMSMNDSTEGEYADSILPNYVKMEKNEEDIDIDNSTYMLSCCENKTCDNLSLWRWYGNEAKGVCIKYYIDFSKIDNQRFFLAPINYANKDNHPELCLLRDILNLSLGKGWHFMFNKWYRWKYFFKPYEFADEKEVRLLYIPDWDIEDPEITWYKDRSNGIFSRMVNIPIDYDDKLNYPLIIDQIILGPNSPNSNVNKNQIYFMAINCGINTTIGFNVENSSIKNYR